MSLAYSVVLPISTAEGAANPIAVVGNRIFTGNINRWVYALDADTGCAIWTFKANDRIRSNVAYEDGVLVFGDLRANAYGLDADTGRLLWMRHVDSSPTARVTGNVTVSETTAGRKPIIALESQMADLIHTYLTNAEAAQHLRPVTPNA